MNELGKAFSIWENGINPFEILPIPHNIWPKDPEDKSTALVTGL